MKILLTGAFGNVGSSALRELPSRGHEMRCFDLRTPANERLARRLGNKGIEIMWGDIRRAEDVQAAVKDRDVVIHLAAIIPPKSDADPALAEAVNVGGIRNLLAAMEAMPTPAKLVHASSLALFGRTQHLPPPRTISDPIQVTDHYTRHKAECERLVRESKLMWAILRFGAVMPLNVLGVIDPLMFEVPLTDRIEFVHTYDVGLALANAAESTEIWGKTLLIGGGKRCQIYERDIVGRPLEVLGIGRLPDSAFGHTPYHTDWMDTTESQQLLKYQRFTHEDYLKDVVAVVGYRRIFTRLLAPLIRRQLLSSSPYYRTKANDKQGEN